MGDLCRKEINFDLSSENLRVIYKKSRSSAYHKIGKYLKEHGFIHRQRSCYVSKKGMTLTEAIGLSEEMYKTFPWLEYCVNRIDVSNVPKAYDLKIIHEKLHINNDKYQELTGKNNLIKLKEFRIKDYDSRDSLAVLYEKISRESRLQAVKDAYQREGIVMSELLRNEYNQLSVEDKKALLEWSGDSKFVEVLDNGDIVEINNEVDNDVEISFKR